MKYLIIYAHPNHKSFNHAIKAVVEDSLNMAGKEFQVRDLYAIGFDPALSTGDLNDLQRGRVADDIKKEQDYIRAADTLIFIHPIWWFNMPAILKGYIDRVFCSGFAFAVDESGPRGLLSDKKAAIFNTTGGSQENYLKYGYGEAVKKVIEEGTLGFCGMEIIMHKYFYAVPYITDRARKQMLEDLKSVRI